MDNDIEIVVANKHTKEGQKIASKIDEAQEGVNTQENSHIATEAKPSPKNDKKEYTINKRLKGKGLISTDVLRIFHMVLATYYMARGLGEDELPTDAGYEMLCAWFKLQDRERQSDTIYQGLIRTALDERDKLALLSFAYNVDGVCYADGVDVDPVLCLEIFHDVLMAVLDLDRDPFFFIPKAIVREMRATLEIQKEQSQKQSTTK